jgi:hypothetical protein
MIGHTRIGGPIGANARPHFAPPRSHQTFAPKCCLRTLMRTLVRSKCPMLSMCERRAFAPRSQRTFAGDGVRTRRTGYYRVPLRRSHPSPFAPPPRSQVSWGTFGRPSAKTRAAWKVVVGEMPDKRGAVQTAGKKIPTFSPTVLRQSGFPESAIFAGIFSTLAGELGLSLAQHGCDTRC